MGKKLMTGIILSTIALVSSVLFYMMTDASESADELYMLNANNVYSTYGTKYSFLKDWIDIDETGRVRKKVESGEYDPQGDVLMEPVINPDTPAIDTPKVPNFTGDEMKKIVFNALKSWGYSDAACYGIMGNMLSESGIDFGCTQGHKHDRRPLNQCMSSECFLSDKGGDAHGIVQWDKGRRQQLLRAAHDAGVEWFDPGLQLSFLNSEVMGSYYGKWVSPKTIMNGKPADVDEVQWAVWRWAKYFEVCGAVIPCDNIYQYMATGSWVSRYNNARSLYTETR